MEHTIHIRYGRLSYPVKCGEDPLIMVLAAGNRGGGGGGLWTEGNWIPLTIATMITSQLHLITDKIVPIWSPGVRRWRRGLVKCGEDPRWWWGIMAVAAGGHVGFNEKKEKIVIFSPFGYK